MSSFAEVRIAAERLEVTEFGPQVADAVRALVAAGARWALTEGGMQRIQLCAVTGNLPSLRVAEKAGFQREGILRRAQLEDDGLHDLVVFPPGRRPHRRLEPSAPAATQWHRKSAAATR